MLLLPLCVASYLGVLGVLAGRGDLRGMAAAQPGLAPVLVASLLLAVDTLLLSIDEMVDAPTAPTRRRDSFLRGWLAPLQYGE